MNEHKRPMRSHDRATRGEALSQDERADLHAWYEQQDQLESDLLQRDRPADALAMLETQLDAALVQLAAMSERLRELSAQNDAIRRENGALKRRLAAMPSRSSG
jgi:hypothetical protein